MKPSKELLRNEIDFIDLIEIIWNGKWLVLIFTLISGFIGIISYNVKTQTYTVTTPLFKGNASTFINYAPLNKILQENPLQYSKKEKDFYFIVDAKYIFQNFLNDFNNSNAIIEVLQENDYVKKILLNEDPIEKSKILINLAKKFKINTKIIDAKFDIHKSNFEVKWHNPEEAIELLRIVIERVLQNVQKKMLQDLTNFSESTLIIHNRKLKKMGLLRSTLERPIESKFDGYIIFLKYQSAIAKELKIRDSKLHFNSSNDIKSKKYLKNNSDGNSYYLKGYVAIDKEIEVLSQLSLKEKILLFKVDKPNTSSVEVNVGSEQKIKKINFDYDTIMNELLILKTSNPYKELISFLPLIKSDNINSWINYNIKRSEAEAETKLIIFIILFLVIGFFAGIIFLIYKAIVSKPKVATT